MRLEPFGTEHLDALREFIGDPDVLRFTRIPEPTPPDFPETWLARYEAARRDGTREAFAAVSATTASCSASASSPPSTAS